jgi:ribosomal protein S18 acetylase RimI-like enzyme
MIRFKALESALSSFLAASLNQAIRGLPIRSPQARFIVVWKIPPEAAAGQALSVASGATGGGEPTEDGHLCGGAPLAFVHYRFLEDDAKPVRTSPFAIVQHCRAFPKHLLPSAPVTPPFPGQVLYIYEIQVGQGARGMGVGQRLMKEVEAEARHKNMAKVLLTVFKRNHAAIHFYKKGDFELLS